MTIKGTAHIDSATSKVRTSEVDLSTCLLIANNLSEVTPATARTNLGLGLGAVQNIVATRINKTFTDFSIAALTKTLDLITVPAKSIIRDVKLAIITPGNVVVSLTLSVGIAGNLTKYVIASDSLAVANTIYPVALTSSDLRLASTTIQATAIATVSNLSAMGQGSFDFYILYETYA